MTDNTEALPPLERAIDDYLDGYVLEVDAGGYTPTEHEKLIVKDAIMGLLEEPEFRAALAQRQQVPEGWQLVPTKVTEQMHVAAAKVLIRAAGLDGTPQRMLDAMLAAAPAAPALTAAPSAQVEPSDDWQHLKQYGYAPGGYMSKCHRCGATPIMDKLAVTCRPCAETMHNEAKGL